jgi:adenine specific DNA methylase Mod
MDRGFGAEGFLNGFIFKKRAEVGANNFKIKTELKSPTIVQEKSFRKF